jgi:hypothetical protein
MQESTTIRIEQTTAKRSLESAAERTSRILREFARYEGRLQEWTARCTVNAIWYLSDPFGAMRGANLGIDEALIGELESLHAEYNRQRRVPQQARRSA